MILRTIHADITTIAVDAIVTATRPTLTMARGVDEAVHKAAGPELKTALQKIGSCTTGSAVITPGFLLPAKYIIHTVVPVWMGGKGKEREMMESCYRSILSIAAANGVRYLAIPMLGTGIYAFPFVMQAKLAVQMIRSDPHVQNMEEVQICCLARSDQKVFDQVIDGRI